MIHSSAKALAPHMLQGTKASWQQGQAAPASEAHSRLPRSLVGCMEGSAMWRLKHRMLRAGRLAR